MSQELSEELRAFCRQIGNVRLSAKILLAAERIDELEAENFSLAANQCEGPMVGDDHGHFARAALLSAQRKNEELVRALADGLDLCTRARKMDEMEHERAEKQMRNPEMTRSATIPIWAEEQYQRDLGKWEEAAKRLMPFPFVSHRSLSEEK